MKTKVIKGALKAIGSGIGGALSIGGIVVAFAGGCWLGTYLEKNENKNENVDSLKKDLSESRLSNYKLELLLKETKKELLDLQIEERNRERLNDGQEIE